MYQKGLLLALEGGGRSSLVRFLTGLDFSVVVVDSMERALSQIRHLDFRAAIFDAPDRLDPLEFILNAREFDESLPIVVIGPADGENMISALARQHFVQVIPERDSGLREAVERLLENSPGQEHTAPDR
jgi:DNA-binding NtrC family response regulator